MRQDNLLGQIWVLWKKSAVHKTSLSNVLFEMNFKVRLLNDCVYYGSMGCGVFKRGGAKFERFFQRINVLNVNY